MAVTQRPLRDGREAGPASEHGGTGMTTTPHTDSSMARADHPAQVRQAYQRVLAESSVRGRVVEVAGNRVHLLEIGTGPPLVLLHGGGGSGGFFLPLVNELRGVRALAPDRPGQGLSDPIDLPRDRYRQLAVAWVDGLLDTLQLDAAALLGHSGGAMWALWYALAHPDRVKRLVPPSPKSVLRFAHHAAREKESLARYPDLVDLFVATFGDPIADGATRAEERVFVSPFALVTASGFRRGARIRPDELRRVAMPTLVMWGEREPLGDVSVARAVAELIPQPRLEVLAGGHGPWLGQPTQTAAAIAEFVLNK